jgi:hypothetical protein
MRQPLSLRSGYDFGRVVGHPDVGPKRHLGSNGSRAVEDAERGLYPCLSMFILLLDCLIF